MAKIKRANKLPKRLAGVKIPKRIRRGEVGAFLTSKPGQRLIAEALLMAGAALVGRETAAGSAVRKAVHDSGDTLRRATSRAAAASSDGLDAASRRVSRLPTAFAEASRAFRDALNEPEYVSPTTDTATWDVEDDVPPAPAKKKPASAAAPGSATGNPH